MAFEFPKPLPSEITRESEFAQRRSLIKGVAGAVVMAGCSPSLLASSTCPPGITIPDYSASLTPKKNATGYNNYCKFSTDKEAIRILAKSLTLSPWILRISGEVENPITIDLDALKKLCTEERIYRFRCVEG